MHKHKTDPLTSLKLVKTIVTDNTQEKRISADASFCTVFLLKVKPHISHTHTHIYYTKSDRVINIITMTMSMYPVINKTYSIHLYTIHVCQLIEEKYETTKEQRG